MERKYVEAVGGPLDGSKVPLSDETRYGFKYSIERAIYHYDYKQEEREGFLVRGRFVLTGVSDGHQQPPEREKGGT